MDNVMRKTASLILAALLIAVFYTGSRAGEREECAVCGMYIDLYQRTRHAISFNDGTTKLTCGLACAAKVIVQNEDKIYGVRVADFLTGKFLAADKAYYLEGSDVPGVMTYTSRIAFTSKAQARSFQKKHGGRIITFDQALKHQREDTE